MALTLTLLVAIGVITLSERSVEHLLFAIAALCFNGALLLFVVADVERAVLLSCIMAATITGASIVKYNHSALKLVVTDLPLVFAGTVPFFVTQYPRVIIAVLAGTLILIFASAAVLLWAAGSPISLELRILSFSLALIGLATGFRMGGTAASSQQSMTQRRCFYATFMASLIDPCSWRQFGRLALSDIANEPLELMEPVPARSTDRKSVV